MQKVPVLTAEEAAALVDDNITLTTAGFVASGMPEALTKALEERFLATGHPSGLTLLYAAAQGNRDGSGADHFAHPGMTRRVIGGHWNMAPALGQLVLENQIEGYNLPQGTLSQLFRETAAHRPGVLTHVGLGTFVDPRQEGGKLNRIASLDLVELVTFRGKEQLFYPSIPVQMAFLRGTTADEYGNITMEHEVAPLEATSIAQAAKNSGGRVIVQVERLAAGGSLDPKLVKIPGICVDAVVVCQNPEQHAQCVGCAYDGSMSGEWKAPAGSAVIPPLSTKKVIARRAALELRENSVVNLGIGIPEYVSLVAAEEGIDSYMTLTVEAGPVGGSPQGGARFGGSVNALAILDQPYQFDFYDGGGADFAFLGLAQADASGNINVSKFGPRIAGCGGFINISQNARRVFFCGTFTAGGLKTSFEDGALRILQEGREKKLVRQVEQITFSGAYARLTGQPVSYITERAVFVLRPDGLHLTEIAPGIDLQTQILDQMEFIPVIDEPLRQMDPRIFRDERMGLGGRHAAAV